MAGMGMFSQLCQLCLREPAPSISDEPRLPANLCTAAELARGLWQRGQSLLRARVGYRKRCFLLVLPPLVLGEQKSRHKDRDSKEVKT